MRKILLLIVFLTSAITMWGAADKYEVKDPESFNARNIGIERYKSLVIVYRIQIGADNIIEVYRAKDEDNNIKLEPVGAFNEINSRKYSPIATPPVAMIENADGETPKFVSSKVTYIMEPSSSAQAIHRDNKEMLLAYADFLDNPDDYPGLSKDPIPDHVEEMTSLYLAKVNKEHMAVRVQQQQKSAELSDINRWFEVALLLPIALLLWLMMATSNNKISVNFNSKIRNIALVEILTFGLGAVAIYVFYFVSWPYIVLGVVLMLIALWLILCLSYRTYEHVRYARHNTFPWLPALFFGYVGMLVVFTSVMVLILCLWNLPSIITTIDLQPNEIVIGIIASWAALFALGYWYYKSLTKTAPQLGIPFIWIAIVTILFVTTVMILSVLIIAVIISNYIFKLHISIGQSIPSGNGIGHDCSKCSNKSMGACSIYPSDEIPVFNCPHYNP